MLGIYDDYGLFGQERWINPFIIFWIQIPLWTFVDFIFPLIVALVLKPLWNLIYWWFTIPPEQKIMGYTYILMGLVVAGVGLTFIAIFFLSINIIYSTLFEDTIVALLLGKYEGWVEIAEEKWATFLEFYWKTREEMPKEDMSF